MGFKEETLVLSEALQGGSNWHKALANLKNNGITGKIVGDKIIIKKNGKAYEISKSLNNLPEDLASNKLDIITVFANRNNGGVSPKHSEDFTAKTNLRLLGKALREENLENYENTLEENVMSESKNELDGLNWNKWNGKFNKRAASLLENKVKKYVFPFLNKYLKNNEKIVLLSNIPDYSYRDGKEKGNFFPVKTNNHYPPMSIQIVDGTEKANMGFYYDNGIRKGASKNWNSLFGERIGQSDISGFNNIIIDKMSKAFKEYAKEMVHDKEGQGLRLNAKSNNEEEKNNGGVPYFTKKERLAYEDYEEDYEENTLNEGFRFFNY